jgi:transketolase
MLGDGELQEGEVWEAAMCAGHYRLAQLVAVIDYNKMQSDDLNENILGLEPLADKWRAFGWHVLEINGHSFEEIEAALSEAGGVKEKPSVLIAHTVKGKGVSFMEDSPAWHGSVKLRDQELETALRDLGLKDEVIASCLDGSIW